VWSTDSLLRSNTQEVTLSGSTTSYNVDGLTPGTRYYFKVFAKNRVTDAAGTTGPYPDNVIRNVVVEGTPVNAPNLTAANPSATVLGRVDLTWTAAPATLSPITRYKVYADDVQIADLPATTLSYVATGLNQRQTYSFTVRALNAYAVNNSTTGPNSNARSAKSPGVPSPPRDLSGVSVGTSVNLNWNAPTDVGTTNGAITGYDIFKANFTPITATGGTVTTVTRDGVVWNVHSFTTTGTTNFVVSNAGSDGEIRYLTVGGGGSGGKSATVSGGGGAGGFVLRNAFLDSGTYVVTVGAGGASKTTIGVGNSGANSSISTIAESVALGGGGGSNGVSVGASGGSGGGGSSSGVAILAGGLGTPGQGNNGGSGFFNATVSNRSGGGGGGAGGPGSNGVSAQGGNGGVGISSDFRATPAVFYAGGGGGGKATTTGGNPAGGTGGGGAGGETSTAGTAGTANTGGGGGGSGTGDGGAGGSGIVVISYPTAAPRIARLGASPRAFTHTDRDFASTYTYTVRARNAIADTNNTASADSNILTVTVLITGPANFTVTPSVNTFGRLVLSWEAPEAATGYRIFDGDEVLLKELSDVTFYAIDNLTAGETYSYKIKAISEAQPEGGYFSPSTGSVSATPLGGTVQSVPSVSVTNDTNTQFSGTYAIISVTATTLDYSNENPSYPLNDVPTGAGSIDNLTNQNLVEDNPYTIAIPTDDTITFTRVGSNILENTAVSTGTVANKTNEPLVGTFTALAGTSGSSILYTVDSPDVEAVVAEGTVTNETTPDFNISGAEITAVTEKTISYSAPDADDFAPSAASGTITNQTNIQVFNGEDIVIDSVTGYNTFTYTPEGAGALLDEDHSSTVEYPLDAVEKVNSEATMDVKYRSGWLA
jgi:hypothetical protein